MGIPRKHMSNAQETKKEILYRGHSKFTDSHLVGIMAVVDNCLKITSEFSNILSII